MNSLICTPGIVFNISSIVIDDGLNQTYLLEYNSLYDISSLIRHDFNDDG